MRNKNAAAIEFEKKIKKVKQIHIDALKSNLLVNAKETNLDTIRLCEKENSLIISEDSSVIVGFCKCHHSVFGDCIRIIFAVKDCDYDKNNTSIDTVLETIKIVEFGLSYVDECSVEKSDNRTFIDFIKKIRS